MSASVTISCPGRHDDKSVLFVVAVVVRKRGSQECGRSSPVINIEVNSLCFDFGSLQSTEWVPVCPEPHGPYLVSTGGGCVDLSNPTDRSEKGFPT